MKRKKILQPKRRTPFGKSRNPDRLIDDELDYIKKHLDKIWEYVAESSDRLQNLEVQMNLLGRLVTALAVEKLNMRLSALRRLIRRIEKETIEDSQIRHLEELYRLEHPRDPGKKTKES